MDSEPLSIMVTKMHGDPEEPLWWFLYIKMEVSGMKIDFELFDVAAIPSNNWRALLDGQGSTKPIAYFPEDDRYGWDIARADNGDTVTVSAPRSVIAPALAAALGMDAPSCFSHNIKGGV